MREFPDGLVSEDQFITHCCDIFPSVGNFKKFGKAVFDAFDTDSSGGVDFTELMVGLHTTADGSVQEKCSWAFSMYDTDGDGVIEFREMKRFVKQLLFFPFYFC